MGPGAFLKLCSLAKARILYYKQATEPEEESGAYEVFPIDPAEAVDRNHAKDELRQD
jgi:hypothetical protein